MSSKVEVEGVGMHRLRLAQNEGVGRNELGFNALAENATHGIDNPADSFADRIFDHDINDEL